MGDIDELAKILPRAIPEVKAAILSILHNGESDFLKGEVLEELKSDDNFVLASAICCVGKFEETKFIQEINSFISAGFTKGLAPSWVINISPADAFSAFRRDSIRCLPPITIFTIANSLLSSSYVSLSEPLAATIISSISPQARNLSKVRINSGFP